MIRSVLTVSSLKERPEPPPREENLGRTDKKSFLIPEDIFGGNYWSHSHNNRSSLREK